MGDILPFTRTGLVETMDASRRLLLRMFEAPRDYEMIKEWWAGHGWPGVPKEVLPKLGVIAEAETAPAAAGWLYMDNSVGVCWIEWLVSNPKARPRDVYRGITTITSFLSDEALRLGYRYILTMCRQHSLASLHERNGFTRTDSDVIHFLKILTAEGA